jgi:D-serine deaminase-like pyridoxal phosphate-dependent protein
VEPAHDRWSRFARAIANEPWPCALVDLDAFDRNVALLLRHATAHGKKLRVASKSIRVPELLQRILRAAPDVGVMTYTARETAFLATQGFSDLLLAYPTARRDDADALAQTARAATLSVVVDDVAHLEVLSAAARDAQRTIDVVVEVDMAFRPLRDRVHLGVRRSPLRATADVLAFVARIDDFPGLRFRGLMGYEAQIAGLGDEGHRGTQRLKSAFGRLIKSRSRAQVEQMRAELVRALEARGRAPAIVNGGGTGNLTWCAAEPALTEVTAGSGFLCSHLFDRYREVRPEPAVWFALQVVRRPTRGMVTCHGGGYVASGAIGVDRLPIPALPEGLALLALEGAGEVQTPLRVPPESTLRVGDPVFFRHAKAGELAEHFDAYLLVRGDRIEGRAPTYRGLGHAFLG